MLNGAVTLLLGTWIAFALAGCSGDAPVSGSMIVRTGMSLREANTLLKKAGARDISSRISFLRKSRAGHYRGSTYWELRDKTIVCILGDGPTEDQARVTEIAVGKAINDKTAWFRDRKKVQSLDLRGAGG